MLGTSESRRAQQWRNESKARHLLDQHGDAAFDFVKTQISDAGWLNIRARGHWRRIQRHLQQIKAVRDRSTGS